MALDEATITALTETLTTQISAAISSGQPSYSTEGLSVDHTGRLNAMLAAVDKLQQLQAAANGAWDVEEYHT